MKNNLKNKFKKVILLHKKGRFVQAEKGYIDILKKKPKWGQVLTALGNLYLDWNRPEKAKPVFEKAARLDNPDLSACYNLARLKQLENDHSGAIDIYNAMIVRQPDAALVWNNLGVAYRETGDLDRAFASFQSAVRSAPDMAAAWNNLGVTQDEQGQTDQAQSSYQKAIEIQPDYISPHLNLDILLQKSKQYKQAQIRHQSGQPVLGILVAAVKQE
jgi:tetratricopeptide (TPR) repeat protein